jgi:hypothetical protein
MWKSSDIIRKIPLGAYNQKEAELVHGKTVREKKNSHCYLTSAFFYQCLKGIKIKVWCSQHYLMNGKTLWSELPLPLYILCRP